MGEHKLSYILPIVVVCGTMLVMFGFNALSSSEMEDGAFINNTGGVSDHWYSKITPSGTTFSIWGLIYFWQMLFIGYTLSTLCRHGIDGYLYYSPGLLPPAVFYFYAANNACNIAWLFMFDRSIKNPNYLIAAFVVLFLIAFTLYFCIGITCYTVTKYFRVLRKNGLEKEAWMMYFMVQNAFGIYGTWCTIATVLNLGAVLTYLADITLETTALIQLGILTVEILTWFCIDLFALDRYTRYLFTPHFVLVWAFTGSFVKNYHTYEGEPHAYYIAALLALSCFALLTKIIAMIYRSIKYPIHEIISVVIEPTTENGQADIPPKA